MKEIYETKEVKEIIGFQANDGTIFKDEDECKKYEDSAIGIANMRLKPYLLVKTDGQDFWEGMFNGLCSGDVEENVYIYTIPNEDVFNDIAMSIGILGEGNKDSEQSLELFLRDKSDLIGKEVVIMWRHWENLVIYITKDDIIKMVTGSFDYYKKNKEEK